MITVPAEGRRLISVPIQVKRPGLARFQVYWLVISIFYRSNVKDSIYLILQVSCSSGKFGDAAAVEFPIFPPSTTESFTLHGTLSKAQEVILQTIYKPADALPQYGALQVRLVITNSRLSTALTLQF